jgi:phosphoribosylpyrophosphate synthetase
MIDLDSYQKMVTEGFVIKNNVVYFDSTSKEYINTSFGKDKQNNPYSSKIPGGVVYSIYKKTKDASDDYNDVLKAIKHKSNVYTIDQQSYSHFLSRSTLYMSSIIKENEIDLIIVMDSSSNLVSDLSNKILSLLPVYYESMTFNKAIFKNPNFDEITFNPEKYGLSDKSKDKMISALRKMSRDGYFSIQKIMPGMRKIIENWLKINDNVLQKIVGKNVAIIDDILTSGSTFYEAARLLESAGANKIIGLTLIKGDH